MYNLLSKAREMNNRAEHFGGGCQSLKKNNNNDAILKVYFMLQRKLTQNSIYQKQPSKICVLQTPLNSQAKTDHITYKANQIRRPQLFPQKYSTLEHRQILQIPEA